MVAILKSTVRVSKDILFRELAGEAILLNLATGKYFGLDKIGTRMWILLTQYGEVAPVHRDLLNEYDVGADQLQRDLLALVNQLVAQGLLAVDEA